MPAEFKSARHVLMTREIAHLQHGYCGKSEVRTRGDLRFYKALRPPGTNASGTREECKIMEWSMAVRARAREVSPPSLTGG